MKVVCIGGAHIDSKAVVDGEVIAGTSNPATMTRTPGGVACNVARNLTRLEIDVALVARVGDDPQGKGLLDALRGEAIDVSGVDVSPTDPTASYLALLDGSGSLAVGIADMAVYASMDAVWAEQLLPSLDEYDVWVVETNLPAEGLEVLSAARGDHVLVADPVSVEKSRRLIPVLDRCDLVFPDLAEAAAMAGLRGSSDPDELASAIPCRSVITLGGEGAFVDGERFPAILPDRIADVTGAGDAGVAGWVFGLARGGALPAIAWSLAASSLAVETGDSVRSDLSVSRLEERVARGWGVRG